MVHDAFVIRSIAAIALFALFTLVSGFQTTRLVPVDASLLQRVLDEWRASVQAPGASLGVVHKDGQVIGLPSGVSDRHTGRAMTPNDLLMAGSTGKTFFAAVALQLIETGRLDLDAPIAKYLGTQPWFSRLPNAKDITVRMLMTHTSGLVRYEMNPKFTADARANPDKVWTPEEQLSYLFDAPAPFAAGQGWDYSDTNYIVLGVILEGITGTKLYDEVQKRFLGPLKLTRVAPTTSRRVPGLVPGYAGLRDPLGLPDEVMTNGVFVINPQFEWTGGGFATSAHDLARWGHALYVGEAISTKMRNLMIESAVPARLGPETKYGLGVIVRPTTPAGPTIGHSGFFPGYQTELVHFTKTGLTLAVQINTSAPRPPGTRAPLRFLYDLALAIENGARLQ
jgi:D-alanyl-D-alanine carboxypeptidase